jgi:hypothetical protein
MRYSTYCELYNDTKSRLMRTKIQLMRGSACVVEVTVRVLDAATSVCTCLSSRVHVLLPAVIYVTFRDLFCFKKCP